MKNASLPTIFALAALVLVTACGEEFAPGEVGLARYFGDIPAGEPSRIIPPVRDRDGNVYIGLKQTTSLGCSLTNSEIIVGHSAGGWTSGCSPREGERRVHGWVGFAQDRAWFWSGDGLFAVSGNYGGCSGIITRDPTTQADVNFDGIIPWVWDRPSRRTLIALISTPTDPAPFWVEVDVDNRIYTRARPFSPAAAREVRVLGTGGNLDTRTGVVLVSYELNEARFGRAMFVNEIGEVTATVDIPELANLPTDAFDGFLAMTSRAEAAGRLFDGRLVVVTPRGATVEQPMFELDGVHVWEDDLYGVGLANGAPTIARLGNSMGNPGSWSASDEASRSLSGAVDVVDDRISPRRSVTWTNTRSAIGGAPFISAYSPTPYSPGAVGWVIAGPTFAFGNGTTCESLAFVSMGVEYP